MNKLINPILLDGDIVLLAKDFEPPVEDSIRRTLSLTLGQDKTTGKIKILSTDDSGNLLLSANTGSISELLTSNIEITDTATLITESLTGRAFISIRNNSASDLYIGMTDALTVETGYIIPAGVTETINNYSGSVCGITVFSSITISVLEGV